MLSFRMQQMRQIRGGRLAAGRGRLAGQHPCMGIRAPLGSFRRCTHAADFSSRRNTLFTPSASSDGGDGVTPTTLASAPPELSRFTSTAELNRSLLVALVEQFQRESLPWIQDLIVPLFEGPPPPLTDTEPPELLADRGSRFISVHGVRIHYKMALPGEREGLGAAAAAAGVDAAAPRMSTSTHLSPPPAESSRLGGGGGGGGERPNVVVPNPNAAPTLLLMHGLNGSTFNWRLLMDDLAAYVSPSTGGCRVVAYDRPPYGLTQRPLTWQKEEDNPYTLAGGARLAAGLLDALIPPGPLLPSQRAQAGNLIGAVRGPQDPRGRAVLVGHSAGAAVAVETALRYPDKVCGLVLIAPAISTDSRGFLARADLGQLMRFAWTRALLSTDGPGLNYVRRQILKRKAEVEAGRLGIYVDEREVPQEVIDGYLRPLRAQDWDMGSLLVYRSLQISGSPPPLEQLRVPVLVLQGGEDRTVSVETAEAVADVLRRRGGSVTEMVVLERCGHVPMDEQPLEVLAAVADFVNRHCCGQ